jgi:hypothetical protein
LLAGAYVFFAQSSPAGLETRHKEIEKIIDPATPPEERAQRTHRLIKGPPEFRDARVDRLKAKGK